MAGQWTIARGMSRLWLVASIGWIVLVIGFFAFAVDKADQDARALAHLMAEAKCTGVHVSEQSACTKREYQASLGRQGYGFWLQLEQLVKPNGWPLTILYLLGILLVPPAVVYVAISGTIRLVTWIGRGFVSPDSGSSPHK